MSFSRVALSDYVPRVRSVDIERLRSRLSEYMRLVRRGETLLVIEREEVVAEIVPPGRTLSRVDRFESTLDALAATGTITRARVPKKGWTWKAHGLGLPRGTAAERLGEIRG